MRLHMVPLGVSKASQVDAPVAHSLDQPGLSELHLREAMKNNYMLIHSFFLIMYFFTVLLFYFLHK